MKKSLNQGVETDSRDTRPICSIIIVNYNGGELVLNCLESVYRFTRNFELFLVDNGSTDGSEAKASSRFPSLKLIKSSSNLGFGPANNIALRRVTGNWIVLLNPDTIVTDHWLDYLISCGDAEKNAGIITPKLMRLDERTIDSAGMGYDFATAYSYDRGSGEIDQGQFDTVEEVPCCCFACAVIRKETLDQAGLFDDKMILYFEDVDYSIRARLAGWRIIYCPKSLVLHVRGGLTRSGLSARQKRAIAYRLRIILKCYNTTNAVKYGALRICRDILSMAAGIKNNNLAYFISYIRSPIWNILNPPVVERRLVQSRRRVSDNVLADFPKH